MGSVEAGESRLGHQPVAGHVPRSFADEVSERSHVRGFGQEEYQLNLPLTARKQLLAIG
jgi:hypothetical protein